MNKIKFEKLKQQAFSLLSAGKLVEAKRVFVKLLAIAPADIELVAPLVQICNTDDDLELAVNVMMRAQDLTPNMALKLELLERACMLCHAKSKNNFGLVPSKRWIALQPDSAKAHFFYGLFCNNTRMLQNAIASFERSIELAPENPWAKLYLGQSLCNDRQSQRALNYLEKAAEALPNEIEPRCALLYALNMMDCLSDADIFLHHKRLGDRLELACEQLPVEINTKARPSRLKVGYLSGDYFQHSVSYFMLPLLEGVDKSKYEVFCYSDGLKSDSMTHMLKSKAEHWKDVQALSADQLLNLVKQDEIDILVDLSGYTGKFRLDVFARRAAPVQLSYLGYPNTSGLTTMDYRLTDGWADPVGKTENLHTETLVRLPSGFLCYSPINTVAVSPLPVLGNTHSDGVESGEGRGVCFGSFNSFQKITDKMLDAWIEILNAVENSRFLLKSIAMQEDETREKTAKYFTDRGIERSRVELLGFTPEKEDHLALYGKVDIHLDTFPYNGTTTTCEALWQGVPTVSLAGDSHRARVGLSILNQVGLSDYIANSFSDYVALAIEKASDLKALSELREGLRERVSNSALTDVSLFATELSDAYEKMYEERVLSS